MCEGVVALWPLVCRFLAVRPMVRMVLFRPTGFSPIHIS